MDVAFSFIIPVYNRPEEIRELLQSLLQQTYDKPFEIVLIEDGSTDTAESVVSEFAQKLNINYLHKPNTGPGDSRNFGMRRAKGNYFIILDSDCILPPAYLMTVANFLQHNWVHCYGGPDSAHPSFSKIQKAINYVMTSMLTTGGIRGKSSSISKFQPRSFNMGISKTVFEATNGFGNIHPGEDPDLTFRIWKKGYETRLIPEAIVYHKRRIDFGKFYGQVKKFGLVRPILNKWHPGTGKITYWFPAFFCLGLIASLLLWAAFGAGFPMLCYMLYFAFVFFGSLVKNKNLWVATFSILATIIQFFAYGEGFLKSTICINFSNKSPQELFPKLFFKTRSK